MVRSRHRRCYIKKLHLKILEYSQEKTVLKSLVDKVEGLNACNFIRKKLPHRYFSVNIAKFSRILILETSTNGCFCKVGKNHQITRNPLFLSHKELHSQLDHPNNYIRFRMLSKCMNVIGYSQIYSSKGTLGTSLFSIFTKIKVYILL